MKKTILTLFFLSVASIAFATENQKMTLELGSASGTMDFKSDDSQVNAFALSHPMTGSMFALAYTKTASSGLIYGAGYHQFSVSGEATDTSTLTVSGVDYEPTIKLAETLKISGIFGLVGYNVDISEAMSFEPQLRIGLGNAISYNGDLTVSLLGASSTSSDSKSLSGSPAILAFPVSYKISDTLFLGASIQLVGTGIEYNSGGTTYTHVIDSGVAFSVGSTF